MKVILGAMLIVVCFAPLEAETLHCKVLAKVEM